MDLEKDKEYEVVDTIPSDDDNCAIFVLKNPDNDEPFAVKMKYHEPRANGLSNNNRESADAKFTIPKISDGLKFKAERMVYEQNIRSLIQYIPMSANEVSELTDIHNRVIDIMTKYETESHESYRIKCLRKYPVLKLVYSKLLNMSNGIENIKKSWTDLISVVRYYTIMLLIIAPISDRYEGKFINYIQSLHQIVENDVSKNSVITLIERINDDVEIFVSTMRIRINAHYGACSDASSEDADYFIKPEFIFSGKNKISKTKTIYKSINTDNPKNEVNDK